MRHRRSASAPDAGPSQRQLRVGEEIRHALAALLTRAELKDPDLAGRSLTVSEVKMSPDLRHATAFVVPLGGEPNGAILKALGRAAPFLRGEIARRVQLRYAPELVFAADRSFATASRISELLHQPDVARDLGGEPDA